MVSCFKKISIELIIIYQTHVKSLTSNWRSLSPMVSRKKLKGKARKAKAKEKARGPLFALLKQLRLRSTNNTSIGGPIEQITMCTHGWTNEFPAEHDCHKFIEVVLDVITKATVAGTACSDAIDKTSNLFGNVWDHTDCLEWIHKALISIGSSILLAEDDREVFDCSVVMGLCEHIHQHLACVMYQSQPFCYHARVHDLLNADQRRLVSYLKKRIQCSCLNDKYREVKALPKMGTCRYPKCSQPQAKVALSKLLTCSRCKIQHYCSVQCQTADWQRHKENDNCKEWSKWRREANQCC